MQSREMELQCRYYAQLIREVLREESEELNAIRGRSRAVEAGNQRFNPKRINLRAHLSDFSNARFYSLYYHNRMKAKANNDESEPEAREYISLLQSTK